MATTSRTVARTVVKAAHRPIVSVAASASATRPAVRKVVQPAEPEIDSRTVKKGQTMFAIASGSRPQHGKALFAHTHAALSVLGMLAPSRPAVLKADLLTILGQRAITWHLKEHNMVEGPGHTIRLTPEGLHAFTERGEKLDADLVNSFIGLFLDGTTAKTGVPKVGVFRHQLSHSA